MRNGCAVMRGLFFLSLKKMTQTKKHHRAKIATTGPVVRGKVNTHLS